MLIHDGEISVNREVRWRMRLSGRQEKIKSAVHRALAAVAAALCLALAGGCAGPGEYHRPGCSVILISIDTLRSDRLGCYGHWRDTSPHIDGLRADGSLFRHTIAQAPSTMASHASIFTSLAPAHHGAFISRPSPLPQSCTTMAEILREAGYQTVSFNDGGQISGELGFDQGFDRYVCLPNDERIVYNFSATVKLANRWLSEERRQPFFLFLHTYHTHHPYTPDKRFLDELGVTYSGSLPYQLSPQLHQDIYSGKVRLSREDGEYFAALYDAEIRQMDHAFGGLVEQLKTLGLYEETLIILTSDHGEELGEHGCWGWHSHTLFEELLRVPLIIKFPGNDFAGAEISQQVRSLDILPTILEVVGVDPPEVLEGRSLIPPLQGRSDEPRPALSQMDLAGRPLCLNSAGWKYYPSNMAYAGGLYRIDDDPLEQRNLVHHDPETAREMKRQLESLVAQRPEAVAGQGLELSEKVTDQLRLLGYID